MFRRSVLAGSTGLLVAASLVAGSPAQAAPDDWPVGEWASTCGDADAVYCIADATIAPEAGEAVPLSSAELTATATGVTPADGQTWLDWGVQGLSGAPAEFAGGTITLVLRTGEFMPRFTTAVADDLRIMRSADDFGRQTLTITGKAAHTDWITTGDTGESCSAGNYCGDEDSMADGEGTGSRFEGKSTDLGSYGQDTIAALDGAYLATNAQSRPDGIHYDLGEAPTVMLGYIGSPQLDANGDPTRNFVTAFLPEQWFLTAGTSAAEALETGFDVVNTRASDDATVSVPVSASMAEGGVRLSVPDLGPGSAKALLTVHLRPSGADPDSAAPGGPHDVAAQSSVNGVAVSWQAPETTGGAPVAGYRVRAFTSPIGGTVAARVETDAETNETELQLTLGETYYIAVTAFSALGEGNPVSRLSAFAGTEEPDMPPSEPRNVKLVAGENRITASWTAPESDGGDPITYYVARAYTTAKAEQSIRSCEVTAPKRTCVLTSLPAGAKIYVGVAAVNSVDRGPEQFVRPYAVAWTVAGAPRGLGVSSAKGKVTVKWTPPLSDGGSKITGYRAEAFSAVKGGSAVAKCTATATGRSCVVSSLKVGKVYYVTVTAINAAGSSPQPARIKVTVRK